MNLLFIGDVVGENGCKYLVKNLYYLRKKYNIDITVINGENSAKGNGITEHSANMIAECGADVITTGNHCFQRRDSISIFDRDNIIRPANYPDGNAGRGVCVLDMGRYSVAVINIQGTAFMEPLDNPFAVAENIIKKIKTDETKNIFVDFHAESTAEKQAMGYFLAGNVTAVLGTHTHVQTADEKILDGGTAYITDVGMCGAQYSILGDKIKPAVDRFRFRYAEKFSEADGKCFINGVVVNFDEKTGKALKIERISLYEK